MFEKFRPRVIKKLRRMLYHKNMGRIFVFMTAVAMGLVALVGVNRYLISQPTEMASQAVSKLDLKTLKSQLTPEVRSCVLKKLGREKAKLLLEEARQIREVPPEALAAIQSCFPTGLNVVPEATKHSPPPGKRFVRIRVFGDSGEWHLTGQGNQTDPYNRNGPYYSPDDVLQMVEELKSDGLDRFYSGALDLDQTLRYSNASGSVLSWQGAAAGKFASGTIGAFLVQVLQRASAGAYIVPRLDGAVYEKAGAQKFFSQAQALYQNLADIGVPADRRFISIDNYRGHISDPRNPSIANSVLDQLYGQGWAGVGVTDLAGYSPGVNTANLQNSPTFADFNVDANWEPNMAVLSQMKKEGNLKKYLLFIDFAQPMWNFISQLTPDQEADVMSKLASRQAGDGYTFVYNIAQWRWDAKARVTSSTGLYHGRTIYDLIDKTFLPTYN